jgi:hypothetical protein
MGLPLKTLRLIGATGEVHFIPVCAELIRTPCTPADDVPGVSFTGSSPMHSLGSVDILAKPNQDARMNYRMGSLKIEV